MCGIVFFCGSNFPKGYGGGEDELSDAIVEFHINVFDFK